MPVHVSRGTAPYCRSHVVSMTDPRREAIAKMQREGQELADQYLKGHADGARTARLAALDEAREQIIARATNKKRHWTRQIDEEAGLDIALAIIDKLKEKDNA